MTRIAAFLLIVCAAHVNAQSPIDTAAVERAMLAEMARTRAPGSAIVIVHDDRIVFARGYGVRSVESDEPVTPETLFRIGSVTKTVTGLAALSLRDRGALAFDRPVHEYVPGLHDAVGRRTLHQLLTHTAGMIALPSADGSHDDAALAQRVVQWTDTVLFAEPGEVYSYSSPGYWLAGAAIERAADMMYADAMRTLVFEPLGMIRSTLRPLSAFTWPVALDHRPAGDSMVVARPYPDDVSTWPGGSVFSSATELALLARALLDDGKLDGEQVLPAAAVRAMLEPQTESVDGGCAYTYGLSHCDQNGSVTVSHYGFRSGSGAVFTIVPEQKAAVIILANSAGAIFGRTASTVLGMMGVSGGASAPPSPREPTTAERSAIAGAYAAGSDTLHVRENGDRLELHARGAVYDVRIDAADPRRILLLDTAGRVVQDFLLVRGRGTGRVFLHDGLNAFGRR